MCSDTNDCIAMGLAFFVTVTAWVSLLCWMLCGTLG
jgi:hypothetical protein